MSDVFVRIDKITKSWTMGKESFSVLKDLSLDIKKGSSIAIVGPSGSGKSTLLHILGLLTFPEKGDIYIDGDKLNFKSASAIRDARHRFGYIFQDGKLISELSVLENVMLPLEHRGYWPKEQRELATEALRQVELDHRLKHKPNQISGGEHMRVAIARAMVIKPELILADEPIGNLDSKTGELISDILFSMVNRERALVLVTHQLSLAEKADRVIHLKDGVITDVTTGGRR